MDEKEKNNTEQGENEVVAVGKAIRSVGMILILATIMVCMILCLISFMG